MKKRKHWQSIYETRDDDSLSWTQTEPEPSLGLILRHSEPGSSIVDIGAGSSRLVDALLENGYSDITLVDIAGSALDRTAERLRNRRNSVSFVVADVATWNPLRSWDVWHDRAVFHFLTDGDAQEDYLKALRAGTKAGSLIVIGTFAEDGPARCSGLPVERYSAKALEARMGSGFECVERRRHVHVTPAGTEQPFTFAVFRRL